MEKNTGNSFLFMVVRFAQEGSTVLVLRSGLSEDEAKELAAYEGSFLGDYCNHIQWNFAQDVTKWKK